MSELGLDTSVLIWSLATAIGAPLAIILLNEIIERLRYRRSAYASAFETTRNIFVPVSTLAVITSFILRLPSDHVGQRLSLTLFLFSAGFTLLAFVACVRAYDNDADRWESRVPQIAKTVTRVLAILLPLALIVTAVWELDFSKFITAIGVGSIAIALALQNTLSSVVSGILLALDKPFREGDWIEINGVTGKVLDLNWRTTRLMVEGRDIVVIPNTQLLDSQLKNYTTLDIGYRDSITFGFAYKDAPNLVKDVAMKVAQDCPGTSNTRPAEVHLMGYGDSSVDYEMHFHVDEYISAFEARRIRDDLMTRLFYAAQRAGLEIPFPIRTVRTTHEGDLTVDDLSDMLKRFTRGHTAFGELSDTVRQHLVRKAQFQTFGRGMPISDIGEKQTGIALILSGAVRLEREDRELVETLSEGEIIGVRYLVGQRSNTLRAVAISDVEILFLDGDDVHAAMDENAGLARALNAHADARIAGLTRRLKRLETHA